MRNAQIFILSLILTTPVFADVPTYMTLQTHILAPSGAPLEAPSVNFRFTILDSAGTCALYVEDYNAVNMVGTQGVITFSLGSGSKAYPPTVTKLNEVFNNLAPSFPCQAGGTFSPAFTDRRQVVMQFNDGSGWQTLPQAAIQSVPYAHYANRAEALGDYPADNYLRPATLPTCTGTQALNWDGTTFTCMTPAGGGGGSVSSVSGTLPISVATGSSTPVISIAKATASTAGYLSSADWTAFNAKASATVGVGKLYLGNASGDATGVTLSGDATLANTGVMTLTNSGVTAGTYGSAGAVPTLTIDAKGRVTSASSNAYQDATNVAKGIVQIGSNITLSTGVISVTSNDITNALGFTPASSSGNNFLNGGNAFSADSTLGASSNFGLSFLTNNLNRMAITAAGNVGIGSTTPGYKLHVAGDVNISGVYRVNGVPISTGSGTVTSVSSANGDIIVATGSSTPVLSLNSGTGTSQIVKLTAGGLYPALDGSLITNLNLSSGTGTLPIANGGTNSSTALNNNRIMVSSSGKIVESAAMTNGQILIGYAGQAPVASTITAGNGITITNGTGTIATAVDAGLGISKIPQVGGVALAANSILMANGTGTALIGQTCSINEILKWNGTAWTCVASTSSQWVTSSSDISYSTGKVSVGTTTPNAVLDIAAGTQTTSLPIVNGTETWNAAGVAFTAAKINVTNTASAAGSLLLDLQVGGVSKFKVDKTGKVTGDGSGLSGVAAIYQSGHNIAIGSNALSNPPSGDSNTVFGQDAGWTVAAGDSNSLFGAYAGGSVTSGNNNTLIGNGSGSQVTTGSNNTALGDHSLSSNSVSGMTGSQNTAIGSGALFAAKTTAHDNTALGYNAGSTITTGVSNILIGSGVNASSATASNELNIGNTIYGNTSTGNVAVGTTTPSARLDVVDTSTTTSAIIVPRAGNFTGTNVNGMIRYNTASTLFEFRQNGVWVNYTTVSDGRLKTNVTPVNQGLSIVNHLNPVFFDWDQSNPKSQGFGTQHQVGFIAQEVEAVLPEVVNHGEDSYRSVEYGKIVAVVVAAVKELFDKVMNQDQQIEILKKEIVSKNREIAELKTYLCTKDLKAPFCSSVDEWRE